MNDRYERRMAYFNHVQRVAIYEDGRCYDCTAQRRILQAYLGPQASQESIEALCKEIDDELEALKQTWKKSTQPKKRLVHQRLLGAVTRISRDVLQLLVHMRRRHRTRPARVPT